MSEELYSYLQEFKPMADKAACSLRCSGEDLLHDTYIKAVQYFDRFPEKSDIERIGAFVYVLLKRTIIDARKHDAVEERYEQTLTNGLVPDDLVVPSAEEEALDLELSPAMQTAMDNIYPSQADTLWLYYVAELTAQDIADLQRVPLGTVLTRLHRGRKMLKKAYREEVVKDVN
jgi:RNA polymerase sigma-70 factor (ECF subfamily)